MTHFEKAANDSELKRLVREAVESVRAEQGSLLLLDMDGANLQFVVSHSPDAAKLVGTWFPVNKSITGYAVLMQQPQNVGKVKADPLRMQTDNPILLQAEVMMVVPLSTPEATFGALTAINPQSGGSFTREEFRRYQELAADICRRLTELDLGMEDVGNLE